MSRIGNSPIAIDSKVQVIVDPNNTVQVKSGKNHLSIPVSNDFTVKIENNLIVLSRKSEDKKIKSLHGLYRSLINNAVHGVTKGFTKSLELHGVGYRAAVNGQKLELSLGYSHGIVYEIPKSIEIKVDKQTTLHIAGADKSEVGAVAAKIRSFRPPEPYLGKGIRYSNEVLRRKAGKSAGK